MPSLSSIARDYALPGGASIVGGVLNRRAAGSATKKLVGGVNTAMDTVNAGATSARRTLADVYGEQKESLDPYRKASEGALGTLEEGMKPGGEFVKPFNADTFKLYEDPGFKFRVQQGERAINAGANAGGIRFSGATLKALSQFNQESASQEYGAARGRAVDDQTRAYDRTRDMVDLGYDAASKEVDAGGTYGANLANLETGTARTIADLQTDLASAEAMGDVAKASSITQTINGILSGVEGVGTAKSLAALASKAAPAAAGAVGGAGLLGGAVLGNAGTAGTLASIAQSSSAAAMAGLQAPAAYAGATGGVAGGGGLAGAMTGFLTNPITIAAGAALGIGLLWRKSQAHRKADEWVKGTQNDFDTNMAAINEDPQLDVANKAELQKANVIDYLAAAMDFAKKGGDYRTVISQAMNTFRRWYPAYASMSKAVA